MGIFSTKTEAADTKGAGSKNRNPAFRAMRKKLATAHRARNKTLTGNAAGKMTKKAIDLYRSRVVLKD